VQICLRRQQGARQNFATVVSKEAMGGHGGLNILPQKSWNVYGQRNREKVARDEKARDEKETELGAKRDRADRERRLSKLRGDASIDEVACPPCCGRRTMDRSTSPAVC
jgi:hypothetical protein